MPLRFYNALNEPSDEEREELDELYVAWRAAAEGASDDDEHDAAFDLIEALMAFASIDFEDVDEEDPD